MDYLKWRWRPRQCDVPKFNAHYVLEMLRGKRVIFVGDSMSRTQWASLVCMLLAGVQDPNHVYEVYGNQISNTIRYLGVHFQTFNLSIQFFRSVFLVQQGLPPKHSPKGVQTSLKLDKMDKISGKWVDSDVLIFNSGHWWTPSKLFEIGSNQKVYKVTKQPLSVAKANDRSELADIISEVIGNMSVPVTVLNVTSMGAYRSDAHVGALSHPRTLIAAISVFLECQMLGMNFCSLIFQERFRAPRFPLEVESETFGSECEIICASGFIWWMNRGKAVHLQERHKLLYLDHKKKSSTCQIAKECDSFQLLMFSRYTYTVVNFMNSVISQ